VGLCEVTSSPVGCAAIQGYTCIMHSVIGLFTEVVVHPIHSIPIDTTHQCKCMFLTADSQHLAACNSLGLDAAGYRVPQVHVLKPQSLVRDRSSGCEMDSIIGNYSQSRTVPSAEPENARLPDGSKTIEDTES
jgi:hypothetical protein